MLDNADAVHEADESAPLDADERSRLDALRSRCPVAHEDGSYVALSHAAVVAIALDAHTFSSAHPTRRAIPNSLDGAEHTAYREVIDQFLTPERVAAQEPQCREVARTLVASLPRDVTVTAIASLGVPFAVRTQSAWLGWPTSLEASLVTWMADNHAATRSGDRARTSDVAQRFDAMIHDLMDARRGRPATDVTGEVMEATVDGVPLTDEEIVSVLRNWTAGDLGSIAASIGVIVHMLAERPAVQRDVRALVEAGDQAAVAASVEEMLRIDDPFITNRRTATADHAVEGVTVPAGSTVMLNWTAANRDPEVFGNPDAYDPAGNAHANLVFGAGAHVCPGRDLTLMELRVVVEELLAGTAWIEHAEDDQAHRETPPVGGWARVPVMLR
ncbi:cytochrome P450 [Demequina sp.]|uniref:cytochrome P450 n=1 Tax=Demequina sp. TaxID=2050685 RepID=UPI003A87797D